MPDIVAVAPEGPLLGPDFITIPVKSQSTGESFDLEVFPDANNPSLRANGLPMQYYYLPKQLYLAKKPDGSGDFDFSVTLFKGLMTTEDTLGISGVPTSGGELDAGGAFVTFSMTMAVPDDAISAALAMLKSEQYSAPPARSASYYGGSQGGPAPLLGIVPIVDNHVTIEVPQLPGSSAPPAPAAGGAAPAAGGAAPAAGGAATPAGGAKPATPTPAPAGGGASPTTTPAVVNNGNPWFISAQTSGQGSIEASGISSFLVTCNQLAAGAIVGSLQAGRSPFVVHYNLSEMFYMNACEINMTINVDKTFMQFSGDVKATYGFAQADLQANYQSCITSGAINTVINENGAAVDAATKSIIDKQVSDMQTNAWNLVKSEIFDWQPKPDAPASAGSPGPCGGVAVQLKANYQKHGVNLTQNWILNETVTKLDGKDGTLTELEPAIQKDLNKYLSIIDIGQYFQKIQVAATPNIDFTSPPDLADPITSASIEVSYPNPNPDGTVPNNADGTPVLKTLGDGFHYTPTAINLSAPSTLAQWTKANPTDIINISFMRLMKSLPNWDADQVVITKKLVYDPDDPRVDLSTGTPEIVVTLPPGTDHTPTVGPDDVGYIYYKFVLDKAISSNVTVTLTVTLTGSQGTRTDSLQLTTTDPRQKPVAVWQVFSDKYFDADIAQVNIAVEVAPPPSNFSGAPVTWSGVQAVPVGVGRIKRPVGPYVIQLPVLSDPAQNILAAQYINQAQKENAGLT